MAQSPLYFRWTGDSFEPSSNIARRLCDERFVVGEVYPLDQWVDHSEQSHRHQFAFVKEAWNSFPDALREQFPTPEHLRKHGLIRKGFCTMQQYTCGSRPEAKRMAIVLRQYLDEYAIIDMDEDRPIVTVLEAESQGFRAMNKKRFQASKEALLDFIAEISGVERETLAGVQESA